MNLRHEPVAIANTFRLVILAAMAFGLELTDAQLISVMAALEAVLTLLTRSQTAPTAVVTAALTLPAGSTIADAKAEADFVHAEAKR